MVAARGRWSRARVQDREGLIQPCQFDGLRAQLRAQADRLIGEGFLPAAEVEGGEQGEHRGEGEEGRPSETPLLETNCGEDAPPQLR